MLIQIGYSLKQATLDFRRGPVVRIVQGHPVEGGKIGLNQIEPRTVGGQPMKLEAVWMGFGPFSHRFCLVRAEIIQDKMNPAMRPRWHHHFLKEIPAVFAGFPG